MKQIVAVTGGNGFIGSHLVELLVKRDFDVKCIVRSTSNLQWIKNQAIEIVDCGLTNVDALEKALEGVQYVFHLAGVVKAKNQQEYDFGNVSLTKNILEACKAIDTIKKIIVVSSLAAAGPSKGKNPIDETKACKPISKYGISKMRQENLVKQYNDILPITVIRPPIVYGPRDTEVFQFIELINNRLMLKAGVFDNKKLSIVYVEDLVEGILQAISNSKTNGETYFLANDEILDWETLGGIIAKILGKKTINIGVPHFALTLIAAFAELGAKLTNKAATINFEKVKEMKQKAWTCSNEKAKKHFNFKPYFSPPQGMLKTINWYKQNNFL